MTQQSVDETTTTKRKRRTPKNDPRFDLRKRLDRFLDNPTNPSTLDSLVSGLVGYELNARLLQVLPPAEEQHG